MSAYIPRWRGEACHVAGIEGKCEGTSTVSIKLEKLILDTNDIPFMSCCVRQDEREVKRGKKEI